MKLNYEITIYWKNIVVNLILAFFILINNIIYLSAKFHSKENLKIHFIVCKYNYLTNNALEIETETGIKLYLLTFATPIILATIYLISILSISVEGDELYLNYLILNFLYALSCSIKTILYFYNFDFVSEILKISLDPVCIFSIMFYPFTDQLKVPFNEIEKFIFYLTGFKIFVSFMESGCIIRALVLFLNLHDKITEQKLTKKRFSFTYILEEDDSRRCGILFILSHYYFNFIKIYYSFGFLLNIPVTLPFIFYIINRVLVKDTKRMYQATFILILVNLTVNIYCFNKYLSNKN
jgi:hypothetical protein